MAEVPHTRFHELREAVQALKDLSVTHTDMIAAINDNLASVHDALTSLASSLTMIDGKLEQLRLSHSAPGARDFLRSSADPVTIRPLKLDFPRFAGDDAVGWLFKASQFFQYHSTPDEHRLSITSFHVDGPALAWYQWMHNNRQLTSWSAFTTALLARFGPTAYDDPQGALAKLTQTSSVESYQEQFEALANRTSDLSPSFLLSCFVAGLKPDICRDVLSLRPTSLVDAIGLAHLQHDKYSFRRSSFFPSSPRPTQAPLLPLPPPKPPAAPPFKVLTAVEQQDRCSRGLCFNCDEKYHKGHRCNSAQALLFLDDDEPVPTAAASLLPSPTASLSACDDPLLPVSPSAEISYQALAGHPSPQTLRVTGHLNAQPVHILIDGGSTHNFIQQRVADHLKLPVSPATSFSITVGNGERLPCSGVCAGSRLSLSNEVFPVDLYVLSLYGADVVLGVAWLQLLGPVTFDYSNMTLHFTYNSRPVTLFGSSGPQLSFISSAHLLKAHLNSSVASFFTLELVGGFHGMSTEPSAASIHPDIQALLDQFPSITSPPSGLPPIRDHNHHIHLLPGSSPTNVRPYRYPYYQKQEIESIVSNMLRDGIIRPSSSPFSAPVLLVKKKDGT